jgi:hypothetical protein
MFSSATESCYAALGAHRHMTVDDDRNVIHPEYPFTDDEHAAAWILLGMSAADARLSSSHMRAELADQSQPQAPESGWFGYGQRVNMVGRIRPAIYLAADIHAGGGFLSDEAREAWLEDWTVRLPAAEANQVLNQLDLLGPTWSRKRDVFCRLLTKGEL